MSDDNELVKRVASSTLAEAYKTGGVYLSPGIAKAIARAAIAEVQRWHPLDAHAEALGPIMLGWAGTGFEPDKGFWDSTTQSWGYLTNEMAFEPFHRSPTHWQPLPAPPQL